MSASAQHRLEEIVAERVAVALLCQVSAQSPARVNMPVGPQTWDTPAKKGAG